MCGAASSSRWMVEPAEIEDRTASTSRLDTRSADSPSRLDAAIARMTSASSREPSVVGVTVAT